VCLGEAAMLTALIKRDNSKFGMIYNSDNKIISLIIMHWVTKKEYKKILSPCLPAGRVKLSL
jgi:hypothetical protein